MDGRWIGYTGFVGNATAVVSRVDLGINPPKFYKISSVLNKNMPIKIFWLCFLWITHSSVIAHFMPEHCDTLNPSVSPYGSGSESDS